MPFVTTTGSIVRLPLTCGNVTQNCSCTCKIYLLMYAYTSFLSLHPSSSTSIYLCVHLSIQASSHPSIDSCIHSSIHNSTIIKKPRTEKDKTELCHKTTTIQSDGVHSQLQHHQLSDGLGISGSRIDAKGWLCGAQLRNNLRNLPQSWFVQVECGSLAIKLLCSVTKPSEIELANV